MGETEREQSSGFASSVGMLTVTTNTSERLYTVIQGWVGKPHTASVDAFGKYFPTCPQRRQAPARGVHAAVSSQPDVPTEDVAEPAERQIGAQAGRNPV